LIYGRCFKHSRSYFKNVPQDYKSSGAGGKIIDKSKKLSETEKHTTDAILGENVNHFKDKALESNK
jgi:hypothetical protein